jgi:hypothetical protein
LLSGKTVFNENDNLNDNSLSEVVFLALVARVFLFERLASWMRSDVDKELVEACLRPDSCQKQNIGTQCQSLQKGF